VLTAQVVVHDRLGAGYGLAGGRAPQVVPD
jgi:hypothetical protein